ncbi:MAG TPA: N-acetyltransferase [Streptosporangiaceae bacterium]|nr:N-acetyltransferase [Streptosporangiaceae bacterium]
MSDLFVPEDFAVPGGLTAEEFRLEPLGPQHNASDYAAWTGSMSHIQATPGFIGTGWPHEMTLAENLGDLERHAQDYADRRGFTYTVLSPSTGDVIGCVYIYPGRDEIEAAVSSWVRADHAELDPVLYRTVSAWLDQAWPFRSVRYASRA